MKVEEIYKLVGHSYHRQTEHNKGFAELLAEMYNLWRNLLDNPLVGHTLPWAKIYVASGTDRRLHTIAVSIKSDCAIAFLLLHCGLLYT